MARPTPLLRHGEAGRLEGARIAVRWREPGTGEQRFAAAPFGAGSHRIGPFEVSLALDVGDATVGVDAALRSHAEASLRLDALVVGFRWSPPEVSALRFLRHGWQSWSFTGSRALDDHGEPGFASGAWLRGMFHARGEPPADRSGWHESDLLTAIGASNGGFSLAAGVLEQGRSFGVIYVRREADAVAVEIELCAERDLAPGVRIDLERTRISLGTDAAPLLEDLAVAHGRSAEARTASPFQAGWCSWYHFFHDVTEADVLRNLDALVKARGEIPVTLVQLDDGYQRAVGDWLSTNEKFPRGLAPLAAEIRAAGFDAGLWTAPFCVAPDSALFAERDWLLRRGDDLHLGLLHPMWTPTARIHVLDTSRDEVCSHLVSLFRELAEMGFVYQKLDFLYSVAMEADAFDPSIGRAERLRRGLEAVRRGSGEKTFLLGCGCPLGPAVGAVDGMRIGPDVAPSWHVDDEIPLRGIEPTRPSVRNGVRSILNRAFLHRRLWLNDPDCLMSRATDTKLEPHEAHTLAVAVAVTGGMVLFSDDVPKLGGESRRLVAETLRVAREVDEATTIGAARVAEPLAAEIPETITACVPGSVLVAVVNPGEARIERTLDPRALSRGFEPRAVEGELLSTRAPSEGALAIRIALDPHASEIVRVRTGPPLAVFCDFDGTFLVEDVAPSVARRVDDARRTAASERFARGELNAWEHAVEAYDGLIVPDSVLDAMLRSFSLDPGARALLDFCEIHSIPFRILSDGYDRNVAKLRDLHGLHFGFDANRLDVVEGRWRIARAITDGDCGCGTGNCKRRRIDAYRSTNPGATIVHIGNGRVSDLCGALAADLVFARGSLAVELERRGARFSRFETLCDVVAALEPLVAGGAGGTS